MPDDSFASVARVTSDVPCDSCGYNLRSLPFVARCPECDAPVTQTLRDPAAASTDTRFDRRWALLVLAGLLGLLWLYPNLLWVELFMQFPGTSFGSAPRLNVPGPKIWAVPLIQRSIGNGVESLGGQGTWMSLMSLVALFLITTRRRVFETDPNFTQTLRLITRWLPPIVVGGFFGFMMNAERTYFTDVALSKYAAMAVLMVELPSTVLLLTYLGHVAGMIGKANLRLQFHLGVMGVASAMGMGYAMTLVAETLRSMHHELVIQTWGALYEALCICVALWIVGTMIELAFSLAVRIAPSRSRAWLA